MKGMKRLIAAGLSAILTLAMLPMSMGTTSVQAATTKATTISNPYVKNGKVVYDCVYFGNYWQKDTNGDGKANKQDKKSPIKWRVLSVDGSKALLVADQVLDCQRYNDKFTSITWADCTMRTWLNGTFKNNAFSGSEQKAIQATTIANKDNQFYGTAGGVNTKDSVFLLSLEDIANTKYGFSNFELTNWSGNSIGKIGNYGIWDYAKLRMVTAFASGSDTATGYRWKSDIGTSVWWLRSPGYYGSYAAYVNYNGCVHRNGGYVGDDGYGVDIYGSGVVPALYLNLSSTANYTYAGTVSCDGNGIAYNEKATGNGGSGSYTIGATSEEKRETVKTNVDKKISYDNSQVKVTITVKDDEGSKVVLKAEDNNKGNIIDGWRNSKTGEMLTTESTFTTSWKVIKETEPEVVFHWDVSKFETTDAEVILLKGTVKDGNLNLTWSSAGKEYQYGVYMSECNGSKEKDYVYMGSTTKTSCTIDNLDQKKCYKAFVVAYKEKNGVKNYDKKTLGAHVAMPKHTKLTNVKSITLNKTEVTIAKGKTFQVTAKSTAENTKKTVVLHVSEYRYEMSKKDIVSVSKKGVIKGLKKGTCTVYVIANNGVRKGIKVTVK